MDQDRKPRRRRRPETDAELAKQAIDRALDLVLEHYPEAVILTPEHHEDRSRVGIYAGAHPATGYGLVCKAYLQIDGDEEEAD